MSTVVRDATFLLLLSCLVCCWATQLIELSYLQCVDVNSLSPRKVLAFPFNQTDLTKPGPSACAESCLEIDEVYVYFLVHVPARGEFANKLVCGCGIGGALVSTQELPDSQCNLPCPQGSNSTIDAVHLTGGPAESEAAEPWFPDRHGATSTNKGRFLALPGGVSGLKNPGRIRKKPPANHRTCGNGHGLLSAYELLQTSSANNSQHLKGLVFWLLILITRFV